MPKATLQPDTTAQPDTTVLFDSHLGTAGARKARLGLACLLMLGVTAACDSSSKSVETTAAPPATATTSVPTTTPTATVEPKPPEPTGPPEKTNVILLTIDSLRADMPWSGYPRQIAPRLSKLAETGVVYENAYAASSYTAKSVSAMLTGRYPSTIYRSGYFFAGFPDSNLFLTEVLQERKVRTLGGHAHLYFDRGKNLNQGFDEWELTPGLSFNSETDEHVTSDKMTDLAISMLKKPENDGQQFFMWLHYMDPHDQYVKHEESPDFGKFNRDRYDSEVYFTDLHIGRLLDYCESRPWWERTAVIVSADHGEAFGEHGMFKHAFELWEVLTHVPLLVWGPGIKPQRIKERRSLVDLAPTILELMGVEDLPDTFHGRSMLSEIYAKERPSNREPIILDLPEDKNNPERHAIISGSYKLIANGPGVSFRLFNIEADPAEEKDLSKSEPKRLEEMKALYKKTFDALPVVQAFGGIKLRSGKLANGPRGPEGWTPPDSKTSP